MESDEQKPPWKNVGFCPSRQYPLNISYAQWPDTAFDPALQDWKEKIALYERFHIWELAKKMANPYECIYTQDDKNFHPSLCMYRPLSRSFYKMIEILSVMQFFETLPKTLQKIRTAHVAEGPGGFIEAFLERAEKHKKIVSSATAMTLKPTDNHTPGWRRANGFLQKHKEVILHYGIDGTGDMYQKGNQESFVQTVKPGVHLFTADGGFDFSTDYLMQEKRIYHLLICSAIVGLQSLLPNGAFILKFFDIYAKPTQILISLISGCFKEWCLYKPATSRPCNSERYLLCRGFRGLTKEVLAIITEMETNSLREFYPIDTEPSAPYANSLQQIVELQKHSLSLAETYIENPLQWKTDFQAHFQKSVNWCSLFQMPALQKQPIAAAVQVVASQMSARVAVLRSRMPDVEKDHPRPSYPALTTSSEVCACDIPQPLLHTQIDEGNHAQTQEAAPLLPQQIDHPSCNSHTDLP
jgi:23S rRNA U2552 (ribose-2'-O)-methylase RlmE/FtsJ